MLGSPQMMQARRWLRPLLLLIVLLGGQFISSLVFAQSNANASQQVLLLYAYGYGGRGVELFSEGFFKTMSEAGFPVTNVYAEYLDLQRNKDVPGYRQELRNMLQRKYAQRHFDLVVTVQQPALEFLLNDGREIAPQAPVIALQNKPLREEEKTSRRIVGELNQFDIRGTLEWALELFPQTQRVIFASGSSAADMQLVEEIARVVEPWRGRLEFEYTTGMALEKILRRVATLPPHTVVIFTQYNVDAEGRVALAYEVEGMIVKAANAPVFGFYDYNLHNGGIGGSVIAVEESGVRAGRLALDILKGRIPATVGTLLRNENKPIFDWPQIRRWGGDITRLPANALIMDRPPSAWQQYGAAIVGVMVFLLAQSALVAVLLNNIGRRQRAESVLSESEERLNLALDATRDGLWDWDLRSGIVYRSPRYYELIGLSPDESTPDFEYFKTMVHPDDLPRVLETIEAHRQGKTSAIEFDFRLAKSPAEVKWMGTRGRAVERDANGVALRIVGTLTDISERKRVDEEIRDLNVSLEQRVEQRTAELMASNKELESFAYAVSHDLRAPLRAMSGFSNALIEDFGDRFEGEAKDYLDQIGIASRKMSDLIEGLLVLSRSTRGELQRDTVDLSALAAGILAELAQTEPERSVVYRVEPGLSVFGDTRMIEAVMRNLLDNAWKYTSKTPEPTIRVYSGKIAGCSGICVADNGAGFDMAHANQLYQPFRRLHRQDEFPGIGIGLATVQRIVHRHGGEIHVAAAPNEGATFCFTLPGQSESA